MIPSNQMNRHIAIMILRGISQVHWKSKYSRISECIFVLYSTYSFIYIYPSLRFKPAHYTLRDFLFELVIR